MSHQSPGSILNILRTNFNNCYRWRHVLRNTNSNTISSPKFICREKLFPFVIEIELSRISSSPSNSACQHHSFLVDQDVLLTTFKENFWCKVFIEVLTTIEFNLIYMCLYLYVFLFKIFNINFMLYLFYWDHIIQYVYILL